MRSAERSTDSPLTVRALLNETTRRLRAARVAFGHGTTNALDEAAWLILHAVDLPLDALQPNLDRSLRSSQVARVRKLVDERVSLRKPAAYLLNEAWLGNHRFYVDERVIVPRSFIAELLREAIAPWVSRPEAVRSALDLCTGSGCLAILAALTFREALVHATDISEDALAVAKRNVADYRLRRRITLLRSDLYEGLGQRRFDVILSNPPYVPEVKMRRLPREYLQEPRIALAGGDDGLDLVRRILAESEHHLEPGGLLVVEVGHNREQVEKAWPRLPFVWAETSGGDDNVFLLTREALIQARAASSAAATRPAASLRGRAAPRPDRASGAGAGSRRRSARGSAG